MRVSVENSGREGRVTEEHRVLVMYQTRLCPVSINPYSNHMKWGLTIWHIGKQAQKV